VFPSVPHPEDVEFVVVTGREERARPHRKHAWAPTVGMGKLRRVCNGGVKLARRKIIAAPVKRKSALPAGVIV